MNPQLIENPQPDSIDKPFLTYSTWQAWMECPALMYFKYFTKVETPRKWGFGFGSAWDRSLNVIAERIMEGKGNVALDEASQEFQQAYKEEMADAYFTEADLFTVAQKAKIKKANNDEIPQEEMVAAREKVIGFWHKWGIERLEAYNEIVAPTLRPKAVQKSFFIDFGESMPFGFKGTIDRIDEDGAVVDNKTSKTRWSDKDVMVDCQGVGYSLAYRIMFAPEVENRVQFDVMVKTKTQRFEDQFQQLVIGLPAHRFRFLLQEMLNSFEDMMAGRFRRNLHKFNGSCKTCEFFDDCWNPSHVWSRPPSQEEIEEFTNADPANKAKLETWIKTETSKARLVDWAQVGREVTAIVEQNPSYLQFWY